MREFKVGDRVISIRTTAYFNIGDTGVIVQTDFTDARMDIQVKREKTGAHFWVQSSDFKLCNDKEAEQVGKKKFKVGDIVVGTSAATSYYGITQEGWTGKVIDIAPDDDDDIKVQGCFASSGTFWVCSDYFDLKKGSTEKVANQKNKFKVGDIVIGNSKANSYGITKEGFKGKVKKVWFNDADEELIQICDITGAHQGPFDVKAERFDLVSRGCPLESATEKPICSALKIKQVIFNDPATIVIWEDDVKTVVKCGEFELFDPEKGLAMCVAKRAWGNKYDYFIPFKKYCSKYQPKKVEPVVEEKPVVKRATRKPVAKNRVVTKGKTIKKTVAKKATTRKTK